MDAATANRLCRKLGDNKGCLAIDVGGARPPLELIVNGVQSRQRGDLAEFGIQLTEPGGRTFVIWDEKPFLAAMDGGYHMLQVNGPGVLRGLIWVVFFPEVLVIPAVVVGFLAFLTVSGLSAAVGYARQDRWGDAVVAILVVTAVITISTWLLRITWVSARNRRLVWRPRTARDS